MREYLPAAVAALLVWVLPALLWRRVMREFLWVPEDPNVTGCNRGAPRG